MTLQGTWQNEYGSQMSLNVASGGYVYGTYVSSTGSTGKYIVVGYQQPNEPTSSAGQAVALAIEWHSILGGQGDNSWNWSSGLSGQISLQNGQLSLVLGHAMVASSDFPGLCKAGTYIDKLIYRRISETADVDLSGPDRSAPLADPMGGTWRSSDGSMILQLSVYPYSGNLFGWVDGKLMTGSGTSLVSGVTDINAMASGLKLQSTGITALAPGGGNAVVYAGCLNLSSGVLTLLLLSSQSTAPGNTFVQTTATQLTFQRVAAEEAERPGQ